MINENQIRTRLALYLRKLNSLDQFEDWIAESSWNMHKDSSEDAQKLASAIELRLGEHSSGHLDEDAMRDELRKLLNPSVIQVSFGNATFHESEMPPNNAIVHADTAVIAFTSRWAAPPPVESFPAAVEFSGTEQLVARA